MKNVREENIVADSKAKGVFRSLKLRFVAYSLTVMLLVAGIVTLLTTRFAHNSLEGQYQQQLSRLVGECTEELRIAILSGRQDKIQSLLYRVAGSLDASSIRLVDAAGNVVASHSDGVRERRFPTISYQQSLLISDKDGKAEEWQIRLRVRSNALAGMADSFMLYQLIMIMLMAAGAVVGIAFSIDVTVSRRIISLGKRLEALLDENSSTTHEDEVTDEFSEIGTQMTRIAEAGRQSSSELKLFAAAAEIVCFSVDPADESIRVTGDLRRLIHVDPERIHRIHDLINLLPSDQVSAVRERWLTLRETILSGKRGHGRRESLWQIDSARSNTAEESSGPVWLKVVLYWSNDAGIPAVYGIIADATDKKLSETVLQAELERFRSIYMNLPVGLWRSHNDQFVSMNRAMAEILGYSSPEEAVEKVQSIGHQLYITPVDRSFFFDELRKRDQVRSLEMKFRRANGDIFWAGVFGRIFYENGKEYCEGCFVDITDKRQAEEKLRGNEEILRQSIEAGCVVAWQFEPVSSRLMLLGAVKRLLGGNAESDLCFKEFCKLIHSEDLHSFKSYFERSVRGDVQKEVHSLDFRICRLNRAGKTEIRHLRILSAAVDMLYTASQKPFRGLLIDVSDFKGIDFSRRSAESARFADMDTAELFTSMSHEIRTPLSAIIGYSELLAPLAENPRIKQYATSIVAAGRSLINIINSIHDLVRLESGKVELIEGPLSIADLVTEVDSMFSEEAAHKGLEFWIQVDSEVPPVILSDEARIREILINLLSNAIKFTNHGSVGVRVSLGQSTTQNSINLLITVEDTGVGIDCENPEDIFDPMYRRRVQNKFGGTGLGLAICRRLVELLNGTIKVKSELQRGSRFEVILREIKVAELPKKQAQPDSLRKGAPRFAGQKILVADDTASNRELIAEAMKNAGLTVICASDGNEAVELAKKELPELIFMDLRMPQKDGVCAARDLRCIPELATVPIVAVTATNSFAELEELKGLFDGFIVKPVSLLRLFSEASRFLKPMVVSESVKEVEFKLPPEAFEQLSNPWKLCEIVSKELMSKFTPVDNAILIDDLTELAHNVKRVSLQHSFGILTLEAESLINGLQNYDVTAIKKSRDKINKIFTQLLKVYSRH
ncbi:MAG: Sensor protein [uncultured bacterium]|nr:MAG: Sensor protein [uncultured bacterium]